MLTGKSMSWQSSTNQKPSNQKPSNQKPSNQKIPIHLCVPFQKIVSPLY